MALSCIACLTSVSPLLAMLHFMTFAYELALLLLALGHGYPALILALVYIGALAVLFLLAVMLFNLEESPDSWSHVLRLGGLLLVLLAVLSVAPGLAEPFHDPGPDWLLAGLGAGELELAGLEVYWRCPHLLGLAMLCLLVALLGSVPMCRTGP